MKEKKKVYPIPESVIKSFRLTKTASPYIFARSRGGKFSIFFRIDGERENKHETYDDMDQAREGLDKLLAKYEPAITTRAANAQKLVPKPKPILKLIKAPDLQPHQRNPFSSMSPDLSAIAAWDEHWQDLTSRQTPPELLQLLFVLWRLERPTQAPKVWLSSLLKIGQYKVQLETLSWKEILQDRAYHVWKTLN